MISGYVNENKFHLPWYEVTTNSSSYPLWASLVSEKRLEGPSLTYAFPLGGTRTHSRRRSSCPAGLLQLMGTASDAAYQPASWRNSATLVATSVCTDAGFAYYGGIAGTANSAAFSHYLVNAYSCARGHRRGLHRAGPP